MRGICRNVELSLRPRCYEGSQIIVRPQGRIPCVSEEKFDVHFVGFQIPDVNNPDPVCLSFKSKRKLFIRLDSVSIVMQEIPSSLTLAICVLCESTLSVRSTAHVFSYTDRDPLVIPRVSHLQTPIHLQPMRIIRRHGHSRSRTSTNYASVYYT